MSLRLTQTDIRCPTSGDRLFTVERTVFDVNTNTTQTKNATPLCRKCQPQRYLQMLRAAEKITLLPVDEKGRAVDR